MKTLLIDSSTDDKFIITSVCKIDDLMTKSYRFKGYEDTLRICNRGLLKSILEEAFGGSSMDIDETGIHIISYGLFIQIVDTQINEFCKKVTS